MRVVYWVVLFLASGVGVIVALPAVGQTPEQGGLSIGTSLFLGTQSPDRHLA
jgi:hypothetical protein